MLQKFFIFQHENIWNKQFIGDKPSLSTKSQSKNSRANKKQSPNEHPIDESQKPINPPFSLNQKYLPHPKKSKSILKNLKQTEKHPSAKKIKHFGNTQIIRNPNKIRRINIQRPRRKGKRPEGSKIEETRVRILARVRILSEKWRGVPFVFPGLQEKGERERETWGGKNQKGRARGRGYGPRGKIVERKN